MSETTTPPPSNQPLPVAVVGAGRMGTYHARAYAENPRVKLVGVHDANFSIAEKLAGELNCETFQSLDDLASRVRAVTIATPTNFHPAAAEPLLKRGIACLIEKPLAKDVAECRRIVEWSRRHGAMVQVGHIERFNPAVRAMEKLNIQPMFIEVDRISPMTFRSIDVGVVLDMMIHDIDIVLHLARSKVKEVQAVGVSVIGAVEDICNARLTFENGCVANVTASRLALKTERKLRVFSEEAYVSLDYQKRQGVVARRGDNLAGIRGAAEMIRTGAANLSQLNYADLVRMEELKIDNIDPLRAQIDAFVDAVLNGTDPLVTVEDGLAAVEIATRITDSIPPRTL